MVAKFNGKGTQSKGAAKPTGKPAKQQPQKIESRYTREKQRGGSAYAGDGGSFNK
jgi:hypothetical protein